MTPSITEKIPEGRICCIDFGLKRIGLALSNQTQTIATKFTILENKGFASTKIFLEKTIKEKNISSFVVGWPLTPNGDEGSQCKLVDNFCKKLLDAFNLPIYKFDERNSTKHCQTIYQSKVTDDVVATMLLQDFLELIQQN